MRTPCLFLLFAWPCAAQIKSGTILSGTILSAVTPAAHTNYDTFARANENPLASVMTDGTGTWTSGPGFSADVKIFNNALQGTGIAENMCAVATPVYYANQQASLVLNVTPAQTAPGVRGQGAGSASCYLAVLSNVTSILVYRVVDTGAAINYVKTGNLVVGSGSIGTGSKLTLKAIGPTLTVYTNDVLLGSTTDYVYRSGQPVVYTFGTTASCYNFSSCDFP